MAGSHGRMFELYIGAVGLSGLLVVAVVVYRGNVAIGVPTLGAACFLACGLLLLSEFRPLFTAGARDSNGVALSTAFVFAILLRYDLPLALTLQTLAVVVSDGIKRKAVWRIGFNAGMFALSWSAAWAVMRLLGHHASLTHPLNLDGGDLLPALAGAVTYFVVNEVLVARAISLKAGEGLWETLRPELAYELLTNGAQFALAPLVALSIEAGPAFVPLLVPSLMAVYAVGSTALKNEQQALSDPLTGLANRKRLRERADAAISAGPVGLVLLDLDRFKEVNDTLGHHVGDQLLTVVAHRLESSLRPGDTVARLGGDEFALLLPGADREQARSAAQRARAALAEPVRLGGLLLDVAASAGVAVSPHHGNDIDELLQHADVAMYLSKESGEVEVYEAARDLNSPSRLALLGELRRAIEAGELELHYQPKIDVGNQSVVGVEALVRWNHPIRGFIPPDEFIPLAETSGLMHQLTEFVITTALDQAAEWRREGVDVAVAVNVSARDLHGPELVNTVRRALLRTGVPSGLLKLELTERTLMAQHARVSDTLQGLEDLGVALSLDDFGTGYSSMFMLKRLPVSELKVDRSFVSRITEGGDDVSIVRTIIDLAHALGLQAVGEGVETQEMWEALALLGCDSAQGWLIARPMPAAEATAWLRQQHLDFPVDGDVSIRRALSAGPA